MKGLRVRKAVDEKIDKSVFRWFGHIERMGNDRNAKGVHAGECVGSRLVGLPWKKWTDSANGSKKEKVVRMLGKQEGWCMIEMNGDGF